MNNEMISFPRELSDDLAELIAEKAMVCGGGAYDIWEAICEGFGKPAAQPQGEPVTVPVMPEMVDRRPYDDEEPSGYFEGDDDWSGSNPGAVEWLADNHAAIRAALYTRPAEQPAPAAVVPDGYCIMPRQLTAENGAKALLLGEFKLLVTEECPECCELEEPTEGCSICDGEGEYGQKHTIPWDQIKFIYSKAVAGLVLKAEPAKSQ